MWQRRAVHAHSLLLALVWFLPVPFARPAVHVVALTLLGIEAARLLGLLPDAWFLLLRDLEMGSRRPASYAWLVLAWYVFSLTTPVIVAFTALVGVAVLDPLMGALRDRFGAWRAFPLSALASLGLVMGLGWTWSAAVPAALLATSLEQTRWRWLDDDLLIQAGLALPLLVALTLDWTVMPQLPLPTWPAIASSALDTLGWWMR